MKFKKIMAVVASALLVLALSACESANYIENCYNYKLEDYIKLGQYTDFVIELRDPAATEEEIDESLELFIEDYITYVETTRDTVQMDDKVSISYVGYMDGVQQTNMTGTTSDLVIGSHKFVDDFEEQLVGVKVGDQKRIYVTFPSNYGNTAYQNKEGVFDVTVNGLLEKNVPELTDEFIQEKTDYNTVAEYREALRDAITKANEEDLEESFINGVWEKVIENATVLKYPEKDVQTFAAATKSQIDYIAQYYYGVTFETYIQANGMTEEEFDILNQQNAQQVIRNRLIVFAISKAEGITIDKAEYEELATEYLKNLSYDTIAEMEADYDRSEIVIDMARSKVADFLAKHSTSVTAK